jgi:hypothetical protein
MMGHPCEPNFGTKRTDAGWSNGSRVLFWFLNTVDLVSYMRLLAVETQTQQVLTCKGQSDHPFGLISVSVKKKVIQHSAYESTS